MKSYEGVARISAEEDDREPVGFILCGEPFSCVLPQCPAWAKAKLTTGRFVTADVCIGFISDCLVPEDVARFDAVLQDKDVIVPLPVLGEIVDDIVEQYTNRPFRSQPSSANGPPTDGRSSTDGSSLVGAAKPT